MESLPVGRLGVFGPAIRDHVFTTHKPVTFKEACREARELAKMRRSKKIILVPAGGHRMMKIAACGAQPILSPIARALGLERYKDHDSVARLIFGMFR